MRHLRYLLLVSLATALFTAPVAAQQIRFIPDFSQVPSSNRLLQFNGSSELVGDNGQVVLRLTQNPPTLSTSSSVFFKVGQPLDQGFFTYFKFQIHDANCNTPPADGLAFVVQSATATDSTQGATGSGLTALGPSMGGMGYSGINNSLAFEFDILQDDWDPNGNHIAIQSCGPTAFNSPVHEAGVYTIGNNHDVTSCLLGNSINTNLPSNLGPTCTRGSSNDGPPHEVVIEYTPPKGQQQGLLQVYLDPLFQHNSHVPLPGSPTVLSVQPYNLLYSTSNPLGLQPSNLDQFYVGFTASVESGAETDIDAWEFTPQAPVQITLPIPPGGMENDFTYGGHVLGVTYPTDFMNDCSPGSMNCIYMTVLATPVNQQTFYMQRLMGTNFANETCIPYLQTGDNNCVVYSVTCMENGQQVTCPQELETDDISICSQFETSAIVSELTTDFLEAEPIGSNNWCSIWTSFDPQDDPIVHGKGQGFSDIVATLSPSGPGPSCFGGGFKDLKHITKVLEKTTSKRPTPRPGQGSGFCPAID